MAGFGGSVKLTGESEYRQALNQITQNLKELSSEMKVVASAYDKNDSSLSAVTAKQDVLVRKLEEQKNKLSLLEGQYQKMQVAYAGVQAKHESLTQSYDEAVKKLSQIESELGKSSKEYEEQKKVVDLLADSVKNSAKEEEQASKAMSKMRVEINNAQADCNKTERELKELGDSAEKAGKDARSAGDGFTVFKGILANLGAEAIQSAIRGVKQLSDSLVSVGKQALSSFGEFEQLEGGVKKIFGEDSAQAVLENANKAFATAGMSANEYMDTVTSFSASLIAGLNGDTAKSAEVADRAIRDMADNANTFGTDIQSIQNAYQGFAKGNFTMLDNLKLGYGGTKTEMLRLVKEAGVVDESVKSIDEVSFDQMIEGIHRVQENMGIVGTTAMEADGTIQGATGSMRASWENLVRGIADENANFTELAKNFVGTLVSEDGTGGALGTIIPRIATVIQGIGEAMTTALPMVLDSVVPLIEEHVPAIVSSIGDMMQGIVTAVGDLAPVFASLIPMLITELVGLLPDVIDAGMQIILGLADGLTGAIPDLMAVVPDVINAIVEVVANNLPLIVEAGVGILNSIVEGLSEAIPQLIGYVPEIVNTIITVIMENLPLIIQAGVEILVAVIQGLAEAIPQLIGYVPEIISTIVTVLIENLPLIIQAGVDVLGALVEGLISAIGELVTGMGTIAMTILDEAGKIPSQIISVGANIVIGIWQGISNSIGWLHQQLSGWVSNTLGFLKGLFGIASPSKKTAEMGKFFAQGLGKGIVDEKQNVTKQVEAFGKSTLNALSEAIAVVNKVNKANAEKSAEELTKIYVTQAKTRVKELKDANQLTETEEVNFWQVIVNSAKKGTDAYNSAVAQLEKAKVNLANEVAKATADYTKEVGKVTEKLNENIEKETEKMWEKIFARHEEIMGWLGLFDEVAVYKEEKATKDELLDNLQDQIDVLADYQKTMEDLRARISNADLFEELSKMGVESLDELKTLASMSREELERYQELYDEKYRMAGQINMDGLDTILEETQATLDELNSTADKELKDLKEEFVTSLKDIGVDGAKEAEAVGEQISAGIERGIKTGMASVKAEFKEEIRSMVQEVKDELEIQSPSKVFKNEVGVMLARGLGLGFTDEMKNVSGLMSDAVPKSFAVPTADRITQGGVDGLVSAFKQALAEMKIELDGDTAGRFIDKTVSNLIYG